MTVVPIAAAAGEAAAVGGAGAASGGAAAAGSAGSAGSAGARAAGTTSLGSAGVGTPPPTPRKGAKGAKGARGKTGTPGEPTAVSQALQAPQVVGDKAAKAFDSAAETGRQFTLTPPKKLTASDGAGFLGGLLLYVLALNYLRYGKDGVKGWLGAKFVNRPFYPPDDSGADGSKDTTSTTEKGSASA